MSHFRNSPPPSLRSFPAPIDGKLDDYLIKHCTLENVKEPFQLPKPPVDGFFGSTAEFCEAQVKGIAEAFREEMVGTGQGHRESFYRWCSICGAGGAST